MLSTQCVSLCLVSRGFAQRVGVPNLCCRPLPISHCLGEVYLELQFRYNTNTLHTYTHTDKTLLHLEFLPRLCKDSRRRRQWNEGRAPMHGQPRVKMSWKKWSEIPDETLKKQKEEPGGVGGGEWSETPMEEPWLIALPYWLPHFSAFRPLLALLASPLFNMQCLCPRLTQLNPVFFSSLLLDPPPPSTPRPVPHPLQFFFPPLPYCHRGRHSGWLMLCCLALFAH